MKSYAVIGLGRFGSQVATRLYEYGEDVLAIDRQETLINQYADRVSRAVIADAKDKNVLRSLGVADCDCAIVALGSDLASSVLITMNLKSLGVPNVICKAHDDTHREILEKLGADQVIIPERVIADKVAGSLAAPNILEYIELSNDYGIVEVKAPASWIGKSIRELNVREVFGVTIIAVKQAETIKVSPSPHDKFQPDTTLVLLGDYKALDAIQALK